jgi:large repetitive protein
VTAQTADYGTALYTVDEAHGTWEQGQLLSVPSSAQVIDAAGLPLVACRSAGNCVIVGDMEGSSSGSSPPPTLPFAAVETTSGKWGAAAALPGTPVLDGSTLQGLSCVPGGDCTVAVTAGNGSATPYIYTAVIGTDGSIGDVQQLYHSLGSNTVYGLSCPQDGYCTLAVELDNEYKLGIEASPAAVALTASAPQVTYGAEQSETLTATVSSSAGGTPTGTVTVTGPAGSTPCTITLANGTGTCTLTARQLPAGTDTLTAAYSGDVDYVPATGTTTVTVARAATATSLSFAPTTITFSGAATKLTVTGTISSTAGTPSGSATVRVDGHAVSGCTGVSFSAGTISCAGTTAILTGGMHTVTLSYSGGGNFAASASPAATLTVGVARSTPTLSLSRSSVGYGSEEQEKFTVSVSHVGSVRPTGKAQVRVGRRTLCTVTLRNGAGSCRLTARQLRTGSYKIVAKYLGDLNYHSSQSARKNLKVKK